MVIKDIKRFSDTRYKARAYICYLFSRNLPNRLPGVCLENIKAGFDKISHEIENFDALYILDENGIQIEDSISLNEKYKIPKGENRANKAYYYTAVREKRCVLSDPYPSSLNGGLCVTASVPIYNEKNELKFIACIDISLENILNMVDSGFVEEHFGRFLKKNYLVIKKNIYIRSTNQHYYTINRLLEKEKADRFFFIKSTACTTIWF